MRLHRRCGFRRCIWSPFKHIVIVKAGSVENNIREELEIPLPPIELQKEIMPLC